MTGHQGGGLILRNSDGTAMTKKEVIIMRRGALKWLPVLCSNDLVHGSWWFFWGAIISAVFAMVPLIQQYETFYHQHDDLLPAADFKEAWGLLIASGIFFALGSLAFVRAFDEPPQRALFYYFRHLQSDELLGAWFFLLGTAPAVPYSCVFFSVKPSFTYMGMILVSIMFLFGCVLFVLGCYPNDKETENYLLPLCIRTIGPRMWVVKHIANDWLAGTWFILWANLFVTVVSFLFFLVACGPGGTPEAIFIWLSGTIVSFLFLVGSAYFVSGSYPHATQFYYVHDRGGTGKKATVIPSTDGAVHVVDDRRHSIAAASFSDLASLESGSVVEPKVMDRRADTVNPLHANTVPPAASSASNDVGSTAEGSTSNSAGPGAKPGKEKKKKKKVIEKKMNSRLAATANMTVVNAPSFLAGPSGISHTLVHGDDDDDDEFDDEEL